MSTRIRWKRSQKTHLFKNALQSEDFWKRLLFVYVWTDENGGFRIQLYDDVIHPINHIPLAWRMLHKGCHRISIVLAFLCGRVFFWKRRKNLWLKKKDTSGRGLSDCRLFLSWTQKSQVIISHMESTKLTWLTTQPGTCTDKPRLNKPRI